MQSEHSSRQLMIGSLLVLIASVALSSKAVIVKLAYAYHINAEALIALRMLISLPFFLGLSIWAITRAKANNVALVRADIWMFLAAGFVGGYGSMWLDFAGLQYVTAGLERIILFLYPTMVVLISAWIFKRHIGQREVFSLVFSYLGVGLVVGHDIGMVKGGPHETVLGALLVLASSILYAGYFVLSDQIIKRYGASLFSGLVMLMITLASGVHYVLSTPSFSLIFQQPAEVYWLSLLMALLATVLPTVLMGMGIKRLGSSQSSLISSIGPVATIFMAYAFLGEAITALQLIGTGLVLVGVMAISLNPKSQ